MSKISPNHEDKNDMVISFLSIRKAVGYLGMIFPFVLVLGTWFIGDCHCVKNSVSAYYYTIMGSYFTGTLCGVALFLFSYKGYDVVDQLLSKLASVFALATAFLPTNMNNSCTCCDVLFRKDNAFSTTAHYIAAGVFFTIMAAMSLFLFTKTTAGKSPGKKKKQRNTVYKVCGYLMIGSLVLIPALKIKTLPLALFNYSPELILESIVLIAFGISWLTKGQALLKD